VVCVNDAVAAGIDKFKIAVIFLDYCADSVARNAGRRLDNAYHFARQSIE
jgi:hypothetical protein